MTAFLSERLRLIVPGSAYSDALVRLDADPETNRFNPSGPSSTSVSLARIQQWNREWSEVGFSYVLAESAETGQFLGVGGCRLVSETDDEERVANVYYRFAPEAWGHGYARELVRAAINHARDAGRVQIFEAIIHPENIASQRVVRPLGFQLDGVVQRMYGLRERWVLETA